MSTAVLLHIGAMKSGTTFLQHALRHHRGPLRRDGVLFPAEPGYRQQVAAVRDLLRLQGPMSAEELSGAWAKLCDQIARWDGRAVVSVEYLSLARPDRIAVAVEGLAPAQVDVVITARDLGRVLPSTWQENVQNGLTWTWPEFCASVSNRPDAPTAAFDRFWRQHDLAAIVERWSQAVGADHVHVVTVPAADAPAETLWDRFCQVADIEAARYPVTHSRTDRNAGLDYAAAELMRRLNVALDNRLDREAYARHVKRSIAKEVLGRRTPRVPIQLEPQYLTWATARGEDLVATLAKSGVDVVGDLAELVAAAAPASAFPPSSIDTEIAGAAVAASAAALQKLGGRRDRRRTDPPTDSRRQRRKTA